MRQNHQNRPGLLSRIRVKTRRHHLLRLLVRDEIKALPKWVKECLVLVIWSRVITYTSAWLYMISPKWSCKVVDPFLFASQPMPVCWLIKYETDDIAWLLVSYAMCKMSMKLSNLLFVVCVIMFGWQLIDAAMFWVNYKRGPTIYLDMIYTALALIYSALKSNKPDSLARIKSLF